MYSRLDLTYGDEIKWPTILVFLTVFLGSTFLLGMMFSIYFVLTDRSVELEELIIFQGYNALILDAGLFIVVILFFKRLRKFLVKSLDFSVLRQVSTYIYIMISMLFFFIIQTVFIDMTGIDDPSGQASDLGFDQVFRADHQDLLQMFLIFLSVAILTPIKEELLYRGIIHRFLEKRHHFLVGLIVSSLIFGLLHIGFPYSAISMGILFVLLYKITNSLIPPIILHISWNSFAAMMYIIIS